MEGTWPRAVSGPRRGTSPAGRGWRIDRSPYMPDRNPDRARERTLRRTEPMEWHRLLSSDRLRRPDAVPQKGRSPFQQDIDRITFSAAFRRLAHKTQMHPLSPNDHVHTRLTHRIEVASMRRSLCHPLDTLYSQH